MKWNKLAAVVLAAVMLMGLLTACGGNKPEGETQAAPVLPTLGNQDGTNKGGSETLAPDETLPLISLPTADGEQKPEESKEPNSDETVGTPETKQTPAETKEPEQKPTETRTPVATKTPTPSANGADTDEDLSGSRDSEEDMR